ncbi:class I SAM-dependent methyltransferase [Solemya pervernicosa gill symbiont]|uniref:class I SAM-dependent methyltransferase n=1 Tax=Solemya pervernicosa gill symbiont TaxID=642797 RepID=UPI0022A97AD7|nr:methyltransferase domain-containing protein [Solemya pervernicosa gill symbiont]
MKLANFTPDMQILDVGCGVGGSTRRLSHETGCYVTGIDLSDEYIDAAERLTDLLKMQDRVKFEAASALDLPFDDNTFDGAWSIQMNMNVEDKLGWLKEVFRAIKPGGRAVLYEVCGHKNTPVYFPVPWAQDSSMSFLYHQSHFGKLLHRPDSISRSGMTRPICQRRHFHKWQNQRVSQTYRNSEYICWSETTY